MKINTSQTAPVSQPVEATAPAKAAEAIRQESASDSAPPQLSREEAADLSKARDTAARAKFAQRIENSDAKSAAIEGGDQVAQLTAQQFVKQVKAFVDEIAAKPDGAAAKARQVGEALDKLAKGIDGMDSNQSLEALRELVDLNIAVQNAQTKVSNRLDFGDGANDAGLKHIMRKLKGLERAVDNAQG